jgi:hypothetical protein
MCFFAREEEDCFRFPEAEVDDGVSLITPLEARDALLVRGA